ncbi:MAG: DNRLRE domain-containing protein, partial [Anaerolineales bacterium]
MNAIQRNKTTSVLFTAFVLFLIFGVFIFSNDELEAQTSPKDLPPGDIATQLSILSGQPNDLELVFVDLGHKELNRPASAKTIGNYYPDGDTTVVEGYPDNNFGNNIDLWAGYVDSFDDGKIVRGLIQFNIDSIPPNSTITNATLYLNMIISVDPADLDRTITTYQITGPWNEQTATWNNAPGFGVAGGSASIPNGAYGEYEFDVTGIVTGWVDGSYDNYGIMLRGPESAADGSYRGFAARESTTPPHLVVEFEAPTPT